jgi:cell wall-associated NlpC family hydrolase
MDRAAAAPVAASEVSAVHSVTDAAKSAVSGLGSGAGSATSLLGGGLGVPSSIGGVPVIGSAGSSDAARALRTAASKLGRPYVWGAAGPSAFDCSGLVQWSYKQLGVKLPRTAAAQSHVGTPVSRSQLKPGDLVFFYSPVSHVGIYIGNNKILNASESGQPVKISSMANMPFHNARRL